MKKRGRKFGRKRSPSGQSGPQFPEQPADGRMLAWCVLKEHDESGRFVSDILSDMDSRHAVDSRERGLAVDVTSGVIRRRRTIDTLLESQISRPRAYVEPELWRLLQLGVYQIVFSDTPVHAAVDTTVELAKQVGCARWCSFANGVLRNVVRLLSDERTDRPAADAVPLNAEFLKLTQPIFADPGTNLPEYVGQAWSLPRVLAQRWSTNFSYHDLLTICRYSLQIPSPSLRVNRLRSTVHAVQQALEEAGISVTPGRNDWSLRLGHAAQITGLPGYEQGWWSVQDESALQASELLDPQTGERILDLCAAPGGKTTHLAELSGDEAFITACDVSDRRLSRVEDSVSRLQLKNVQTVVIGRDGTGIPEEPYDAVLVDVPCSNTGVLARRPEARWRFRDADLTELVQLQTRLLLTAYEKVRSGGRIVYSTCSIEPEETTQLAESVERQVSGLTLESQMLSLPGKPGDGAFRALLRRC